MKFSKVRKALIHINKHINVEEVSLSDADLMERELCEDSFYAFIQRAWPVIEGNREFIPGWHAQAICEHVEALYDLEIRNLLINCPPRVGKSNIISCLLTPWVWTQDPHLRFLYSSYAQNLTVRDSVKSRRLIQSAWYQKLWGHKFKLMADVNHKLRFDNNESGFRIASSVGGQNTGEGGDFVITDDPNNIKNTSSDVVRDDINEWWDFVMSTRFSNFKTGRRLVVQQRTHSQDLSGHILSAEEHGFVHLKLPMEFNKGNRCITIPTRSSGGKNWRDPRKKNGDLLWPGGIDAKELQKIKTDFRNDAYRISGQLAQEPSPEGGGIIRGSEWFQLWTEVDYPKFEYVLTSWDTALTKSRDSCYSASVTFGVFKDKGGIFNVMLLSVFRERLEYPDLRKMAMRLYNNYEDVIIDDPLPPGYSNKPDLVLIEGKVSGYSLHQDLMRANIPVTLFNPNKHGDKMGRARIATQIMENGLVWLPTESPKHVDITEDAQIFLHACELFPNDESNDIVDATSQAFIRLMQTGWVFNKEDPRPEPVEQWKAKKPYF